MPRKDGFFITGGILLSVAATLAVSVGYMNAVKGTEEVVTAAVVSGERVCSSDIDGNSTCKWLIFTSKETFENTDTAFYGKYNSHDFQNTINQNLGKTCDFTVVGWRVGWASMLRNVVDIQECR